MIPFINIECVIRWTNIGKKMRNRIKKSLFFLSSFGGKSLLEVELSAVSDRFDEIQGVINLYHALGGGY